MLRSSRSSALAIVALLVLLLVRSSPAQGRNGDEATLQLRQMGARLHNRGMSAREESSEVDTRLPVGRSVLHHTRGDRISDSNVVPDLRHQQQHRTPHKHSSAVFDPLRHSRRSRVTSPSNNIHSRLDPLRRWDLSPSSQLSSSHLPHNDARGAVPSSSRSFRAQESHDSLNQFSSDRRRSLSSSGEPYSRIRTRQNYSPYSSSYGNSRSAQSEADALDFNRRYGNPTLSSSKEMSENIALQPQTEHLGRNLTHLHRQTHSSPDLLQVSREIELPNSGREEEHTVRDDPLSRNIDEIVNARQNASHNSPSGETSVQRATNSNKTESPSLQRGSSLTQEVEGPSLPSLREERGEPSNETSTRGKKSQKKQKKTKKRRNRNRRNRSNKGKKKRRRLQNFLKQNPTFVHDVEGESFLDCCPSKLIVIEKQVGKARDNHAVELHPDSQYFYERVCLDQFEGEECIFPSRALKPWVKTRCAPTYSFSQALVRKYASDDDWSLDYVEVSSGCSCQVSLDSVAGRSNNDRSSNSTSGSRH